MSQNVTVAGFEWIESTNFGNDCIKSFNEKL